MSAWRTPNPWDPRNFPSLSRAYREARARYLGSRQREFWQAAAPISAGSTVTCSKHGAMYWVSATTNASATTSVPGQSVSWTHAPEPRDLSHIARHVSWHPSRP